MSVSINLFLKDGDGNPLLTLTVNDNQGIIRHRKEVTNYLSQLDTLIEEEKPSKMVIVALKE